MKWVLRRINDEPVMTFALLQSAIALAVKFGLNLSADQTTALWVFCAAALGWATRSKVTPNA